MPLKKVKGPPNLLLILMKLINIEITNWDLGETAYPIPCCIAVMEVFLFDVMKSGFFVMEVFLFDVMMVSLGLRVLADPARSRIFMMMFLLLQCPSLCAVGH
ncbi:hypothetical protein VNO77_40327 [Canavalia gladiata]|uniref:Uncharacterized protein n=1 Tax=Canavalia gladiata TaxID=3824 RepID=A0AAN9PRH5_CANGL